MKHLRETLEYIDGRTYRTKHTHNMYHHQLEVNGILYQEPRDYVLVPDKGKLIWHDSFDLDSNDTVTLSYKHICNEECSSNRSKAKTTKVYKEPVLVTKKSKIGVTMFWRALFYAVLATVLLYSAYIPMWTIFFPLVADILYSGTKRLFRRKKKKDYTYLYKGVIHLPHNRDKKKVRAWAKSLAQKGFKVIKWDRKGIEFKGSRVTFRAHANDEILSLAYIPERKNLMESSKLKKVDSDISSGPENTPPVYTEGRESFIKAVNTLKDLQAVQKAQALRNFQEYNTPRTYTSNSNNGDFVINLAISGVANNNPAQDACTKDYVDSLYACVTEEPEEEETSLPPIKVKPRVEKQVKDLRLGESVYIVPWGIEVSDIDGTMFVNTSFSGTEELYGTRCVRITRIIGGYRADLSRLYSGHTWTRNKNLNKFTPGYKEIAKVLV